MAKADSKDIDRNLAMTLIERLHVQKALQLYAKSIERSRNNELPGSDVYAARTRDLAIVRELSSQVS